MRRTIYKNLHRVIAFIAVVVVFIAVVLDASSSAAAVYAESDIVTAYENQNVLDDLEGSTIAGVEFDLADYPFDEDGKVQVISFLEYCYSYDSDNQDDYGLYIYVYNPQGYVFDDNSELNKISFRYAGVTLYQKYSLELLNYSTKSGYEGLFYKFKIVLNENVLLSMFSYLNSSSRVYTVVSIELAVNGISVDYEVGTTYTYSGYSLGYGSESATESSLSCSVSGFDRYFTLDVQHTVYYPEGDYYNGQQCQLNSCYFRVPNTYLEDYGVLTNIFAEWYEYLTKPILVTEDYDIYKAIYSLYGSDLSNLDDGNAYFFAGLGNVSSVLWGLKESSEVLGWSSNYYDSFYNYSNWYYDGNKSVTIEEGSLVEENFIDSFAAVFYTGSNVSYSDYYVDDEDIQDLFLLNSQYLANNGYSLDILGKYCSYLFEDYIDSTGNTTEHVMGYNQLDISSSDILKIYSNSTTKGFWENAFGGYSVSTEYDDVSAIVQVSYSDIKNLSSSTIAEKYFINENDVSDFKTYVKYAEASDETVYLIRYGCSNSLSIPFTQSSCSLSDSDYVDTLCEDNGFQYCYSNYSAYVCKETVYLNFDIISLTFTAEDGVETVIPVVMSPQDVFSDTEPPLEEDYGDSCNGITLKLVLSIVLLVVLLIICAPLLPYVAKFIVWIVSLPFKLIAALCRGISNSSKERKQKKKEKNEKNESKRE